MSTQSCRTTDEYLALELVDGLGELHLGGFRKLRVQTAAHLLLSLLLVLVLRSRESFRGTRGADTTLHSLFIYFPL